MHVEKLTNKFKFAKILKKREVLFMRLHIFGEKYMYVEGENRIFLTRQQALILSCFYQNKDINSVIDALTTKSCLNSCDYQKIKKNIHLFLDNFSRESTVDVRIDNCLYITGEYQKYYPRVLSVELSDNCNFKCGHCYKNADCYKRNFINLSIIDDICKLFSGKVQVIHLTGGEPLLHDRINEIIDRLHESGFLINVTTNGSAYRRLNANTLKKVNNFQISLYGYDEKSYKFITRRNFFDSVVDFMKYLNAIDKPFDVSLLLNRLYLLKHNEYNAFVNSLGAKKCIVGFAGLGGELLTNRELRDMWILNSAEKKEAYKYSCEIEKSTMNGSILNKSRNACQAGTLNYSIDQFGKVRLCQLLSDSRFVIGDLPKLYDRCQNNKFDIIKEMNENHLSEYVTPICKYYTRGENLHEF